MKKFLIASVFVFLISIMFITNQTSFSQTPNSSTQSSDKLTDEIVKKIKEISHADFKLADRYNKQAKMEEQTASQELKTIQQEQGLLDFITAAGNAIGDLKNNPAFANAIADISDDIQRNTNEMNHQTELAKADKDTANQLLDQAKKLEQDANSLEKPVVPCPTNSKC